LDGGEVDVLVADEEEVETAVGLAGEGGDGVRWNHAQGDREHFTVAAGGEPFEGFRWRTDEALKVNFVWAYLYITKSPPGHESKVWFDHIVVAKEYIGPLRPTQ